MVNEPTASVPTPEPLTLARAEAFDIRSAAGPTFRISVGFPVSYAATARVYPVLYVVDGDTRFASALEFSRLRGSMGEIEEIVVVGIGYPLGTDFLAYTIRRTYDFSTADWDRSTPLWRDLERVEAATGQKLLLGGAPTLLEFITDELQPMIANRYRVDPEDSGLFGVSAGGNFVAHTLFRRPSAFAKYIAASPGLIYNDWDVFRLEEEYARAHSDLPVTFVLGAGSDESEQLPQWGIVSGTTRLAETLRQRKYPGLRLTSDVLTGKTHLTAPPEILQRGLEVGWPGSPMEVYDYEQMETRLKALRG